MRKGCRISRAVTLSSLPGRRVPSHGHEFDRGQGTGRCVASLALSGGATEGDRLWSNVKLMHRHGWVYGLGRRMIGCRTILKRSTTNNEIQLFFNLAIWLCSHLMDIIFYRMKVVLSYLLPLIGWVDLGVKACSVLYCSPRDVVIGCCHRDGCWEHSRSVVLNVVQAECGRAGDHGRTKSLISARLSSRIS